VKNLLLGNLSTKFMALFLAGLTWMYLFTQDTDRYDLEVLFQPRMEARDLASARFIDSRGEPLSSGTVFKVGVTGPKGDVRALRPRTFKCEPIVASQALTALHGSHEFTLKRSDFDLPEKFSVDPLPSPVITLRYVKFVTRRVRILATPNHYVGFAAPDHRVESITPIPAEIDARVPADREDIRELPIQSVRLDRNQTEFTVTGELADPDVQPITEFKVRVLIVPDPKTARLTLDLNLSAKPENLRRISLEEKSIVIELRGPEDLVREAEKRPAAFQPYVIVTDTDMEPTGLKTIGALGCHILDPKFRGGITVVLQPDQKPEDRQVKVKIDPRQ
jgi:hypothetical protein